MRYHLYLMSSDQPALCAYCYEYAAVIKISSFVKRRLEQKKW